MTLNQSNNSKGLSGNALRTWGYVFLLMGIAGQSILQNQILGLGSVTSQQLLEAMDQNPNLMGFATLALVLQAAQTCAAPIFAFLLVEGVVHTSNLKRYFIRVLITALVSELPYNLAMNGTILDLSSRNPVFGLVLSMIMIMFYQRFKESGLRNMVIKLVITVAAMVWGKMLGIHDGGCLVLLAATFWGFRNKTNYRNLAGCVAACLCSLGSMFYLASPMAVMALHMYNGEPGSRNQKVNYAAYPVALLLVGIVAKFL